MSLKPGQDVRILFSVCDATGKAVFADSLPTASLVLDIGLSETDGIVTARGQTGFYSILAVIPITANAGQMVDIRINATVNGVMTASVVHIGVIDTKRVSELNDNDKLGFTLTSIERDNVATALLDLASAVDGFTVRSVLKLLGAVLGGQLSGAATNTIVIKGLDDATTRITATVDSNGNRTAVTKNI